MKKEGLYRTVARRKGKGFAVLGAAVFVFAIVGLVTTVIASINWTSAILDNTEEKQKLEAMIQPVIMFDPLTFDSPQQADPVSILKTSLWSTLLSKERNAYLNGEQGALVVPVSDVDVQAAKLFGPDLKLQHQSFGDWEMQYTLDEEQQAYLVPIVAQMSVYTAKIQKITPKGGDIIELQVAYIPPGTLWTTDAEGNRYEPTPDKVMLMELKKVKGGYGYNVLSLKDMPTDQPATENVPTT